VSFPCLGARKRDRARRRGNEFELCEIFVAAYELDTSLGRCGAAQREFPHLRYRRYPAISLRVDGLDEARFQRIVAEQSPQLRDEPCQSSGSDDDPTPDLVEQRIALDQRAAAPQQHLEHLHRLWFCVQYDATTYQAHVPRLKPEFIELVSGAGN